MFVFTKRFIVPVSWLMRTKLTNIRYLSATMSTDYAKSLLYEKYGDPTTVLQMTKQTIDQPASDEVLVKWLLSPINPADINTIQGKYPSRPSLPAIAGNEGVGEIVVVGSNVENLCVGDRVVPNELNLGTWRTHANYNFRDVSKVPSYLTLIEASMLNVNPCTAYRMLKDFISLKPGDTVIQNGANSAVGQLVIQLCKLWNYKSINIVRDRINIQELKDQLIALGADEILTVEELRTTQLFKSGKLPAPKLALNCISGQIALETSRHLAHSGVMVTYGGMAREPLTIPVSSLIFKNHSFKGFWMTAWTKANLESKERVNMFNDLANYYKDKKLQAPKYKLVPFDEYREAMDSTANFAGGIGLKYILDMTNS